MSINKQSNVYTVVYIIVMVIAVGCGLAFIAMGLKDKQVENANADKMSQILQAAHITTTRQSVVEDFAKYIVADPVIKADGQEVAPDGGFEVNMARDVKLPADQRELPVYVCQIPDKGTKYILPLYGMGLWGPIWGYVAFDADGTTIYGAFFDHQGETPGLGAEIAKPAFRDQFDGLSVYKNGHFVPVSVVKKGLLPQGDEDYVDGISGGTITSKGVASMLADCLAPYEPFLMALRAANGDGAYVPCAESVDEPCADAPETEIVTVTED